VKLYLAQHGDSLPEQVNPERPLSEQGQEDIRRLAEFIARAGVRVRRIYHSGKLRARQTAELLGAHLAPGAAIEATSGLNPNDPVEPFANQIRTWTKDALLVGHLPFMGRLVTRLVCRAEDSQVAAFQPGSLACLERDADGHWAVAWMLRPELFRR
jgi:phosphohistidine phosphatase